MDLRTHGIIDCESIEASAEPKNMRMRIDRTRQRPRVGIPVITGFTDDTNAA